MHAEYLATSSVEGFPLLEGVPPPLLGETAAAAVTAVMDAAAAARLVGVDFGDPTRTEGFRAVLPRVRMGDSRGNTDTAATRFAAGAPPPPDLGEDGAGLEVALRFVGDLLGDTGGFFLAEAAAFAAAADTPMLGGGICGEFSVLGDVTVRPDSWLLFLAAAEEERRVAGRVGLEGEAKAAGGAPPFASRACLMLLNCRLISAV